MMRRSKPIQRSHVQTGLVGGGIYRFDCRPSREGQATHLEGGSGRHTPRASLSRSLMLSAHLAITELALPRTIFHHMAKLRFAD